MDAKVIILTTGGTIGHSSGRAGIAALDFEPAGLLSQLNISGVDIEFRHVFRKGSMDIVPDDWLILSSAVLEAIAQRPAGIVVLHGTDTLQYTACALTFLLGDCGMPVVITGSMIPGGDPGSDSVANLRDAITVAARADFAEVCVVFSADSERSEGVIIRGCRARKVHSRAINAFASINSLPIGRVSDGRILRTSLAVRPRGGAAGRRILTSFDQNVALVKLTPNMSIEMLAKLLLGSSAAVLEGTGVGHIRTDLQPVVAQFGKPVVISTQAVYGGERLGGYEVDRHILALPNIIPGGDMPSETALVKLMWALGQDGDVRAIMLSNIAGELDAATPDSFTEHER
jgi:glutamyl-tRNA(Gln) amidotransferase subunit D